MSATRVVILGGGIGGLSAAHELVTRGFDVEVYELQSVPGGKARSYGVADTGKDGRHDLPAEHGFRFFPGYYKHVIDTMAHTPYWDTGQNVSDRLTGVDAEVEASFLRRPTILPAKLPHTFVGFFKLWRQYRKQPKIPVGMREGLYYMRRLWQILTSCHERRDDQYEQTPWWEYIQAEQRSLNYQRYLGNMTRTLVAADPKKVSTRTNGNNWLQVLQGMFGEHSNDRVLDGPTNEVWIYPWLKFLIGQGVKYYVNARAVEFLTEEDIISGVRIVQDEKSIKWAKPNRMALVTDCDRYGITKFEEVDKEEITVRGDYYVSGVPVERMAELVCEDTSGDSSECWSEIASIDPALRKIKQLSYSVAWMNGLQFYLKAESGDKKVPTMPGHAIYVEAPFALTSIFQTRYWKDIDLERYGDGSVQSILSVDISNWSDGVGRIYDKPAFELTRTQVKDEVWEDLKVSLRHDPDAALSDANLVDWYLDFDITYSLTTILRDKEPLLVNRVNTWRLRPRAYTAISNLCIASDYVQTNTDLATMEGANEAARRAVNYLLDETNSDAPRCKIWRLEEPEFLSPFRAYDRERYTRGGEWSPKFPILMKLRLYWTLLLIGLGLKKP